MKNDYYWMMCELAVSARCSPSELCRAAGLAPATALRWRGGENGPTMRTWGKVTEAAAAIKLKNVG